MKEDKKKIKEQKEEKKNNETYQHDFSYAPTDISKSKTFSQPSNMQVVEKKIYKPIDHP